MQILESESGIEPDAEFTGSFDSAVVVVVAESTNVVDECC